MKPYAKTIQSAKIAIIHDAVTNVAGGERVISALAALLPNADIYTSVINDRRLMNEFVPKPIHTTWAQYAFFPRIWRRSVQLLSPYIWSSLDLSAYDIIISHGGFYFSQLSHTVRKGSRQLHVHYAIAPPYNIYNLKKMHMLEKYVSGIYYPRLQKLDQMAIHSVDSLWTVSRFIQRELSDLYNRRASVLYPPVFSPQNALLKNNLKKRFYCYAGRLESSKQTSLVIDAFNKNGLPLIIVGNGKDATRYKNSAKLNISFIGQLPLGKLQLLYSQTIAFIHAAEDDPFPLAPLEAMACGVPVVCRRSGGLVESVIHKKTGVFFEENTIQSLNNAIYTLSRLHIRKSACISQANKFSTNVFNEKVLLMLASAYEKII